MPCRFNVREKVSMLTNNEQCWWVCKNSGTNSWAQGWVDGIKGRARNDVWYSSQETGWQSQGMEIVAFGFWFRNHLAVAKASKPPPAQSWCSCALFHWKHPSFVTTGLKLYKIWKTKLIILPGVHRWHNSAAPTTWDKSILTSLVTSNQLCNSSKKNPHIPC